MTRDKLIFDAHLDLAWNAIDWNRDLTLPVEQVRRREREQGMEGKGRGEGTVSFPELRRGRVGLFIATLLARLLRPNLMPAIQRYESMAAAYAAARGQMEYYRALEKQGVLRWVKDADSLDAHVRAWTGGDAGDEPLGFILSMEGADPVLYPEQVHEWYEAALRVIGPAHYGVSPYAHGTGTEGGLFPEGRKLLKEMEKVGMILDVTHLSDECFDEALDLYGGPVLASHHNCRALVPDQRQLTDAQIKRLVGRGAVIGAALDDWMLVPGWERGRTRPEEAGVRLGAVVDHVDRVCQLAGDARHAGLGSDLDGGFGREQSPLDLDTVADLGRFGDLLRRRGYAEGDVDGILYGNWVRFFRSAWGR
jgi:membrane dipeptidase